MISYQLQSSEQGYQKIYLAHAKSQRHILQIKWI